MPRLMAARPGCPAAPAPLWDPWAAHRPPTPLPAQGPWGPLVDVGERESRAPKGHREVFLTSCNAVDMSEVQRHRGHSWTEPGSGKEEGEESGGRRKDELPEVGVQALRTAAEAGAWSALRSCPLTPRWDAVAWSVWLPLSVRAVSMGPRTSGLCDSGPRWERAVPEYSRAAALSSSRTGQKVNINSQVSKISNS